MVPLRNRTDSFLCNCTKAVFAAMWVPQSLNKGHEWGAANLSQSSIGYWWMSPIFFIPSIYLQEFADTLAFYCLES